MDDMVKHTYLYLLRKHPVHHSIKDRVRWIRGCVRTVMEIEKNMDQEIIEKLGPITYVDKYKVG